MSEEPIKKSSVIENDIFLASKESARIFKEELIQLEKHIKTISIESTKYFTVSIKTLADLEKRKEALQSINTLEKLNTETLKQKSIVEEAIQKLDQAALKNAQDLEKLRQQEAKTQSSNLKTSQEFEKLKQQGIKTQKDEITLKQKLEGQERKNKEAVENSTQALRNMMKELARLPAGSKEFNELAKKAGALKDKIGDAKDAVKAFASESKLTNAKTLFSQIGSDLANMNFSDAADKAKILSSVVRSMTFAEAAKGVKDFGSTLLNLGKAILLNPFTLIIASVVGLGVALWNLKDRVKIIGDAIDFFGNIITSSIQSMKDFSDWIGITAFAAEDKANRIKKAAEVEQDAIKRRYDLEISLSRLSGKETLGLERLQLLSRQRFLSRKLEQEKLSGEDLEKILKEKADIEDDLTINREMQRQAAIKRLKADEEDLSINKNASNKNASNKYSRKQKEKEETFKINEDIITNETNFNLRLKEIDEENQKRSIESQIEYNQIKIDDEKKFVDYELKALKGLYGDVEKLIAEEELSTKVALGLPLTDEELDYLKTQKEKKIKDEEDVAKKQIEQASEFTSQITKGLEEGLKEREQMQQAHDQNEIDKQGRLVSLQEKLAVAGKDNVLAESEAKLEKLEEKKIKDQKKAIQAQKALAMADVLQKSLSKSLSEGKGSVQAIGEALASSGIISNIFTQLASGFYEGSEGLKESDGIKIGKGKDNILIRAHEGEKILGVEDSAMIPDGMTNKDIVKAAIAYTNPDLKSTFYPTISEVETVQDFNSILIEKMTNEITEMKNVIIKKPVQSNELNRLGEWTERIREGNMETVLHHKKLMIKKPLQLHG